MREYPGDSGSELPDDCEARMFAAIMIQPFMQRNTGICITGLLRSLHDDCPLMSWLKVEGLLMLTEASAQHAAF